MPAALKIRQRTADGTTNIISYSDRGFEPKALITIATGTDLDSWFGDATIGLGFAADNIAGGVIGYRNDSGDTTPDGECEIRQFALGYSAATMPSTADIQSFDQEGETLDWGANVSGDDFISLAIGGDDLQARVGSFDLPTSGSVTVSGLPFQPTFLYIAHANRSTFGGGTEGRGIGAGFTDFTNSRSISIRSPTGLNATEKMMFREDSITHHSSTWRSDVVATSDGFTLTPDAYPSTAIKHVYLAMTGVGTVTVGTETQKTSTGVKSTDTGNTPTLVLFIGGETTAADTDTAHGAVVLGMITDQDEEGSAFVGTQDIVSTSVCSRRQSMTKAIMHGRYDQTMLAEADGSLTVDGFDLDWTTADATARQFAWAALEVPVATSVYPQIIRHFGQMA